MYPSSCEQGGQQQGYSTASFAFLGTEDQGDGESHTKACTILHVLLAPRHDYLTLVSFITSPLSRLQTEVKQSLSFLYHSANLPGRGLLVDLCLSNTVLRLCVRILALRFLPSPDFQILFSFKDERRKS